MLSLKQLHHFIQKLIWFADAKKKCLYETDPIQYLVSTADIDGLVLHHQGISSNKAEYAQFISRCIWVNVSSIHKIVQPFMTW